LSCDTVVANEHYNNNNSSSAAVVATTTTTTMTTTVTAITITSTMMAAAAVVVVVVVVVVIVVFVVWSCKLLCYIYVYICVSVYCTLFLQNTDFLHIVMGKICVQPLLYALVVYLKKWA